MIDIPVANRVVVHLNLELWGVGPHYRHVSKYYGRNVVDLGSSLHTECSCSPDMSESGTTCKTLVTDQPTPLHSKASLRLNVLSLATHSRTYLKPH